MSELRLNPVTREWVIIAKERARRPHEFTKSYTPVTGSLPAYLKGCPFCPGNEEMTPPEKFRIEKDGRWTLRVVPNKYAALSTEGEKIRKRDGVKHTISGVGRCEVIIESPLHNTSPAHLPLEQVEEIIKVYRERFLDAYKDPRVEHVIIFRNHGEGAGTSLMHPHSQLIATPVVPVQFRDRVNASMHYFDDTGNCLLCDIIETELKDRVRVIFETKCFVTFIPHAALSPFHTWIFPRRHCASFAGITEEEIGELAMHLKNILARLYKGLNDPDYNYVIRSSRPMDMENEYCHWYVSLVPRLTRTAGFELGTGMYINISVPEESAEFLKTVEVTL